jgi:hypothetical protein
MVCFADLVPWRVAGIDRVLPSALQAQLRELQDQSAIELSDLQPDLNMELLETGCLEHDRCCDADKVKEVRLETLR